MDACLITILIVAIILVIGIVLLIKFGSKPKPLCSIPNRNIFSYRDEIIKKLTEKGYLIKEKQNNNIFVQKDTFSATTLVFKQEGPNVNVSYIHSNSTGMLIAFIVSFIFIWIIAIALALIADSKSETFRNTDLLPVLTGNYFNNQNRICPNCGRSIPFDANICPYCGLKFN